MRSESLTRSADAPAYPTNRGFGAPRSRFIRLSTPNRWERMDSDDESDRDETSRARATPVKRNRTLNPRLIARTALLALAAGSLVALTALPASAHSYLVSSTPADGSTITELPDIFSVTTNETLLDLAGGGDGFGLQVTDSNGNYYGDGCLTVADATLSTGASLGLAGDYTMIWQVVSEDGHPVSGELAFTWEPADDSQSTLGSVESPVCGEQAPTAQHTAAPLPTDESEAIYVNIPLLVGGIVVALLGAVAAVVLLRRGRTRV